MDYHKNMQKEIEISERCRLFRDYEYAIFIYLQHYHSKKEHYCLKCNSSLEVRKKSSASNSMMLRCSNNCCRSQFSLFFDSNLKSCQIQLCDLFFLIYKFVKSSFTFDIIAELNISKPTIIKIQFILINLMKMDNNKEINKLGGVGCELQCDETAVSIKRKIICPNTSIEECRKTKWLLGLIDKKNLKKFKLFLLPNRKKETFKNIFLANIIEGTIIKTDGHPSYLEAVYAANCIHKVVNHTEGFKNDEGEHTNFVENLWSCFKSEVTKRHGVSRKNLESFIEEWQWKRRIIPEKTKNNFVVAFWALTDLLF